MRGADVRQLQLSRRDRGFQRSARPAYSGGHRVRLLCGGDDYFPLLLQALADARNTVWLATYIFHDDDAALMVADALKAAALRGVQVRVVVDGFGSHHSLASLQQWFAGSKVAFAVFRPLNRWYSWLQPGQLRRMHQKLCVVDSTVAYVGGINVIDDRNDLHHGRSDAPRLDFAVQLEGPVVSQVEQTACAMWSRASFGRDWRGEMQSVALAPHPLARTRSLLRRMRIAPPAEDAADTGGLMPVRVAFAVRDNLRQRRTIERCYLDAIRHARFRIDLASPYFYPGHQFRRSLLAAARRGVRVRLLLQGKLDYRLAGLAAHVLYDELRAGGIEIYEYTPAFLHAKTAVVDDEWVTVGSSNIDPLSLLLNLEANVVIADSDVTRELSGYFDTAFAASSHITAADATSRPRALLRRGFVAWLAYWYLRLAGLSGRY